MGLLRGVVLGLLVTMASIAVAQEESDQRYEDQARAIQDQEARIEVLEAQMSQFVQGDTGGGTSDFFDAPHLSIRGFAHVGYGYNESHTRDVASDTDSNAFDTGGFTLIITSQISERISFFNETEFKILASGASALSIARVKLNVDAWDWLRFTMGKGHTAIGYWNKNYHHGAWVDPTIERPLIYAYEGGGGILPLHYQGLEMKGDLDLGLGTLSYVATLANGRGTTTTSTPVLDRNDSKMTGFTFTYQPVEGLGFGLNGFSDRIPADSSLPTRTRRIEERIYGAHLYYRSSPWDFASEVQLISHDDHTSDSTLSHYGGFAHLGYELGRWTPYYRFDFLNLESGDPFFATSTPTMGLSDTIQHTLGVRWDIRPYLALKAELRYLHDKFDRESTAGFQAAFAF